MSAPWTIKHPDGETTVSIGDVFAFPHKPDEQWQVVGEDANDIESDYGISGMCPVLKCKQVPMETITYLNDRNDDWTVNMCGDLVAHAIYLADHQETSDE